MRNSIGRDTCFPARKFARSASNWSMLIGRHIACLIESAHGRKKEITRQKSRTRFNIVHYSWPCLIFLRCCCSWCRSASLAELFFHYAFASFTFDLLSTVYTCFSIRFPYMCFVIEQKRHSSKYFIRLFFSLSEFFFFFQLSCPDMGQRCG